MIKEEDKKRVLGVINNSLPEGSILRIGDHTLGKEEIIRRIQNDDGVNDNIASELDGLLPSKVNALGKRYVCLICKTEVLCTRVVGDGGGPASCCGQNMWVREPKWIPSSD